MTHPRLDAVLGDEAIHAAVRSAAESATVGSLSTAAVSELRPPIERLVRLGLVYEAKGLEDYGNWSVSKAQEDRVRARDSFERAFDCWAALSADGKELGHNGTAIAELRIEGLPPKLAVALHIALAGLLSERPAEARLRLAEMDVPEHADSVKWRDHVAAHVARSFVLLTRKLHGWADIDNALASIASLREFQKSHEEKWLAAHPDGLSASEAAAELIGFYHLAQMMTLTGEYLTAGVGGAPKALLRLDRHRERATAAFGAVRLEVERHLAVALWAGCRELVGNSVWTHAHGLGERTQSFVRLLTGRALERPVIELWPAQQRALNQRLLDPYPRAVLVEMPTSAGKTLLAKFAIVQTLALNPNGTIAYIVPTRALANQIVSELRRDFAGLNFSVEQTIPAFELDPTESRLLEKPPHILVTTPEKLDLLLRKSHPAVAQLALVVADEAHNLADRSRGARLELLLGTLKREVVGARFLLLSPFVPASDEILTWLGEDRTIPPIRVDWRPARKVVAAAIAPSRKGQRSLVLETLPAAGNTDVRAGLRIPIAPLGAIEKNSISEIVESTVGALRDRGGILVLCRGPGTAITRATQLAASSKAARRSPDLDTVIRYLEAEWGGPSSLSRCVRKGIAYHHAGLSAETRWLIEGLVRRKAVDVVCGTTTLAQGVNFPISTVIVESAQKGDDELSYSDFWNIAGRAGRALTDTVGLVVFPTPDNKHKEEWAEFLRSEAKAISSQLASLIDRIDEIGNKININTLFNVPQLSPLLQFMAHAMRVSGSGEFADSADEIVDLLRASLVYHQAGKRGRAAVDKLVALARAYLQQIKGYSPATLLLADQTGFATPSVQHIFARKAGDPGLSDVQQWSPDALFSGDIRPLASRVSAIASLPEMQLGSDQPGSFSAERVANILSDWVRGVSLKELANRYAEKADDPSKQEKKGAYFARYLFGLLGKASWGLGALEGVCLAGADQATWDSVGHVPSMVYYGVSKKESVWLRMVGVPRVAAEGLGELWRKSGRGGPESYDEIRGWVTGLDDKAWKQALPREAALTPADMRWVWTELNGTPRNVEVADPLS